MHKNEMKKIEELSGDISKNLFMMRAIRKAIEKKNQQKEERKKNNEVNVIGAPHWMWSSFRPHPHPWEDRANDKRTSKHTDSTRRR